MLFSMQEEPQFYKFFENILHGFLSKVISEILQTCIKAFLHVFEEKNIFGNISLLGLGRNIIIGHDDDDCDIDRYTHIFGKLSIHTY